MVPPRAPQSPSREVALSEPRPESAGSAPSGTVPNVTREIPTSCSGVDGCFPEPAFAERVCRGKFPDLPLAMFAKGTPWQHLYVKAVTVAPVNVYGGARSDREMQFGEEVVVLRRRGPGSGAGVQISGPTDLDVLRWDGTCATVREEMFVSYIPGEMMSPRIVWKYLDDPVKDGLMKNGVVLRAQANERKHCRDSSPKNPSPACDKAMKKLTDAIVLAVHLGIELPPGAAPEWQKPEPTASR